MVAEAKGEEAVEEAKLEEVVADTNIEAVVAEAVDVGVAEVEAEKASQRRRYSAGSIVGGRPASVAPRSS